MELRERLEKLKQKQKGFTLVELIVVIAIIGILAGVMLPQYFSFTDDAREAAVISEAKSIRSLAEAYYAKEGDWPVVADDATGFTVGDATTEFSGVINTATGTAPLEDGSFDYTKDGYLAECDENGTITASKV